MTLEVLLLLLETIVEKDTNIMSCNCGSKKSNCNCKKNSCFEGDATKCCHGPVYTTGRAPNEANNIVTVCDDYTAGVTDRQIDVTAAGVTIKLSKNPQPGDEIAVAATAGSVDVEGGCFPLCDIAAGGHVTVPGCRLGIFKFTTACKWVWNVPA